MKRIKNGGNTMVYLFFALYAEAKPFLERWKCKKQNQYIKYQVFEAENICCVITGVGTMKMAIHGTHFLSSRKLKEEDIFCNIGVAGTKQKTFQTGELYAVYKIHAKESGRDFYPEVLYRQNFKEASLESFSKIVGKEEAIQEDLVDMEGAAFFETMTFFTKRRQIFLWKCVSDFLEGERVQPEVLLEKHVEKLEAFFKSFIQENKNGEQIIKEEEKQLQEILWQHLFCSETMCTQGRELLHYAALSQRNVRDLIEKYLKIEVNTKSEGKKYFEELRNEILEF